MLALGVMSLPGRAEDADPFSATVAVDATADNVATARDMARTDGQRRALAVVAARLAGGSAPAKLPKLDDNQITDLVASFEVANERMSAVRYAADYTFHFKPEETRRILGNAAAAAAAEPGKPLIVLPVYQSAGQATLWDDPNPWRQAWEQLPAATGPVRLVVPLGDAGDIAAIDADKALAGDGEALAAIARRNGGDEAIVALAAPRGPPDRPDGLGRHGAALSRRPARRQSCRAADRRSRRKRGAHCCAARVAAIVADIGSGWKNEAVAHDDQEGTLTAVLPITGLDDWVRARSAWPACRRFARSP